MAVTFKTQVIGDGNHASLEIPQWVLDKLQTNKRAPLKVTINGHTYQSTATGVDGACRVVFPSANRKASGAKAGDEVSVTLELDSGHRQVELPKELIQALRESKLQKSFEELSYSRRKEYARAIFEAKAPETKAKRVAKVITDLRSLKSKS